MPLQPRREFLDADQLEAISAIERACSVLSLLGCILTIGTFCASKSFHKPVNRLVFYASFGNMLSNVGTLMSQSYNSQPISVQCQFQAFLIQMFMPADAFWTLAMAVNVYLTFYHKFDAEGLRKMEVPYLLICYGIPFVPAFTYLWVRSDMPSIYGDATLWCWISDSWEVLRIATFYGPVWLSIVVTFIIYIRTGRTIYEKRRELYEADLLPLSNNLNSGCGSVKTTDISVTTERAEDAGSDLELHNSSRPQRLGATNEHYTVTITAEPPKRGRFLPSATCTFVPGAIPGPSSAQSLRFHHQKHIRHEAPARKRIPATRRKTYECNNAAWAYTKCSILFFLALLITWVPSSANRVFSLAHPGRRSAPLEFMSAFVLPLQGFWNAVIYCVTSWKECKSLWKHIKTGRLPDLLDLAARRIRRKGVGEAQEYDRRAPSPTAHIPLSTLSSSRSESIHGLADPDASDDGKMSC